ncbi:MAG: glycosyltransferase family 2 protein [Chlamydiota bacterium]
MSAPLVYVIVLSWNGMEHLPVCLASLKRQSYPNFRVLLVDNGSTDGSRSYVRREHPGVELIENGRNLGFAEGNNRGMRLAMERGAEFVILLNNDTECDADLVAALVAAAMTDPSVGACAAKLLFFDARTVLNGIGTEVTMLGCGGDRGMGEKDEGQYNRIEEVFGVSGGACLLRSAALRKVGLFEPGYFIFLEDIDLSWRIRLAGYRILAVPGSVVYHKFNATMGSFSAFRIFLNEKNRIRNVLKNFSARTLRTVLPRMLRYDTKLVRDIVAGGGARSFARAMIYPRAYAWNLLHLPGLLVMRRRVRGFRAVSDEEMLRFITPVYGQSHRITPDYPVHDRRLYERSSAKPPRIVMGESDTASLGAGWANLYRAGPAGEKARRLSTDAWFFLPRSPGAAEFLEIAFVGCPVKPLSGEVFANGARVGPFALDKDERRTIRFPLGVRPRLLTDIQGVWECRIVTKEGWRQNDDFGNGDYRLLGPSVGTITLSGTS